MLGSLASWSGQRSTLIEGCDVVNGPLLLLGDPHVLSVEECSTRCRTRSERSSFEPTIWSRHPNAGDQILLIPNLTMTPSTFAVNFSCRL